MKLALALSLAAAAGCASPTDPVDEDGDTDWGVVEDTDDGPGEPIPGSDEASVVVFHEKGFVDRPEDRIFFGAVFAETLRGFINLPQCIAFQDTYCVEEVPKSYGEHVELDAFFPELLNQILTRNIGNHVQLGPYIAPTFDIEGLQVYFAPNLPLTPLPPDPLDLSFGPGEWGVFNETAVIAPPAVFELLSPDPMVEHTWTDGEPVRFEWTPGETGEIYLGVLTRNERRLYLLEDTGSYDLDLNDFLLGDQDDIDISIGRWNRTELEHPEGHTLFIQTQADQWLKGEWLTVGGRAELDIKDTCNEAQAAAPTQLGSYWADISEYLANMDPLCVPDARGEDGFLKIELAPHEAITATYRLVADDAVAYFMSDCNNVGTCLEGFDTAPIAEAEIAAFTNPTDSPQTLYLVLDSQPAVGFGNNGVTDILLLDLATTQFQIDMFPNHCIDAVNQGPLTPGAFAGDLSAHANVLDPGYTCGPDAPGGEGIGQFVLQSGEKLTAEITMPGFDPALYALYNCGQLDSCAAVANLRNDEVETLQYLNDTLGSENIYLVLDGVDNSGEYSLQVTIE